ncbi:MAG: hypothetical protein AAGL24_29950 [Pseudomonadota bacterium]
MPNAYRAVMDSDVNPLRHLPVAQRFQVMTYLSMMWTTIFCAAFGAWAVYGELVFGHILMILGVLVTAHTFHQARRVTTYRDHPREDGTARYDDVWGA